jgi:hypothetical protein
MLAAALGLAAWFVTGNPGVQSSAAFGRWRDRWALTHLAVFYLAGMAWLRYGLGLTPRAWRRVAALHLGVLLIVIPAELCAWAELVDFRSMGALRHQRMGITYAQPVEAGGMRWYGTPHLKLSGRALPDLAEEFGLAAVPRAYRFETDSYGLRNVLDETREPEILCLGDSLLVGGLVAIEDTLAARLTGETERACLSVAEVEFGPQEEVLRLESTGISLADKLVLQFVFEGNDLLDSRLWREWAATGKKLDWPESGFMKNILALVHKPVARHTALRGAWFSDSAGAREEIFFMYSGPKVDEQLDELPVIEAVYGSLAQRLEQDGGRYALILIPHKLRVLEDIVEFPAQHELAGGGQGPSGLSPALAAFCLEEGIPYLDLATALQAAAGAGELPFFPKDTHLNEAGLATCAAAVGEWLGEQGLIR